MVPRLQVNGRPNVTENLDGKRWGKGDGLSAGKSGSRIKNGDKAAGGVVECKMAKGWGTVAGREQVFDGRKADAGSGKESDETWLRSAMTWSPREGERRLGDGKLGMGGGKSPTVRIISYIFY